MAKRRAFVALSVVCLAIFSLLPFADAVWRFVNYASHTGVESVAPLRNATETMHFSHARPMLVKRWAFVPGAQIVLQDSRCYWCRQVVPRHEKCNGQVVVGQELSPNGPGPADPVNLPCDCSH